MMEGKKKIFFENLDGLRFLAFLSVFFYHSFYTTYEYIKNDVLYQFFNQLTRFGWLGVNFFFILSGFLITYLILIEEKTNGKINLKWFYIRRVLRIWPLYYLVVLFCFFVYPILSILFVGKTIELPDIWLFILHLSNYNYIHFGSDIPTLGILWSVSIEEQFYFVWPLLLILFKNNRGLMFVLVFGLSLLFTWYYISDYKYYHFHLFHCMRDLALGGLSAYLIINKPIFLKVIRNQEKWLILLIYIVGLIYLFGVIFIKWELYTLFTSTFFTYIILEQNYANNSLYKISKLPLLSFLGKYTYGLYCYHYLALLMAIKISQYFNFDQHIFGVLVFENALGLIITVIVAIASYHLYELPFLKMKNKFTFFVKK